MCIKTDTEYFMCIYTSVHIYSMIIAVVVVEVANMLNFCDEVNATPTL